MQAQQAQPCNRAVWHRHTRTFAALLPGRCLHPPPVCLSPVLLVSVSWLTFPFMFATESAGGGTSVFHVTFVGVCTGKNLDGLRIWMAKLMYVSPPVRGGALAGVGARGSTAPTGRGSGPPRATAWRAASRAPHAGHASVPPRRRRLARGAHGHAPTYRRSPGLPALERVLEGPERDLDFW